MVAMDENDSTWEYYHSGKNSNNCWANDSDGAGSYDNHDIYADNNNISGACNRYIIRKQKMG